MKDDFTKLNSLKLHEEVELDSKKSVMRVPGGWIYRFYDRDERESRENIVFVPFNNDFQLHLTQEKC